MAIATPLENIPSRTAQNRRKIGLVTFSDGGVLRECAAVSGGVRAALGPGYPDGVIRFSVEDTWFLGRYELKGDTLRLCFPGPIEGDTPTAPTAFESAKGSMATLATWKRVENGD